MPVARFSSMALAPVGVDTLRRGGGVRIASRPTIRTYTAFVPREKVTPRFEFVEA